MKKISIMLIVLLAGFSFQSYAFSGFYECEGIGKNTGKPKMTFVRFIDDTLGGFVIPSEDPRARYNIGAHLRESELCREITDMVSGSYNRTAGAESFLCQGHFISDTHIYGQVLISEGALDWLLNTFIPFHLQYICKLID